MGNSFFSGHNVAESEEACLHDGIDATAHARFFGDLVGIDGIDIELLVDNLLLHGGRILSHVSAAA